MKKLKRGLSLILVVAIIIGACFIGGVISASAEATVVEEGNLLLNGSFEQSKNMNLGFTDREIKNGQVNYVGVEAWRYRGHYYVVDGVTHTEKQILATHDYTDAHSGNFALKFTNQGTGDLGECTAVIFPDGVVGDVADYATGHYRFSVWVKGTNTASYIEYTNAAGTRTQVDITDIKEDEWTQIVIDDIAGIGTTTVTPTNEEAKAFLNLNLVVQTQDNATEILFDDARLEKISDDSNLIIDGGFETPVQDEIVDTVISHNAQQTTSRLNWAFSTWSGTASTVTRVANNGNGEVHTGNWALRVDTATATGNMKKFLLTPSNFNENALQSGIYRVRVWVKGTNTTAYLSVCGQKVYVPSTAGDEWTQLIIDGVKIESRDDLGYFAYVSGSNVARYDEVFFYVPEMTDTYVVIDDFVFEKSDNLVANSSLEVATRLGGKAEKTANGSSGQFLEMVDGWCNYAWSPWSRTYTYTAQNPHSGSYALRFDTTSNNGEYTIGPEITNILNVVTTTVTDDEAGTSTTTYTIPAGTYKFSVWVRGSAPTVKLTSLGTTTSFNINSETEWQQISVIKTLTEDYDLVQKYSDLSKQMMTTSFNVNFPSPGTTDGEVNENYVVVDDFALEKIDTPDDVKDQITGIAQPAVDAIELTLPTLDTNNDDITVSIAASSDENIIALDGTITEPKVQTVVDITLQISDGTNTVTLEPIGVLVHGELDTVTQAVIEAAIEALNVKADSAEADIAEIEGWLRYKPTYVSTAKSNIFSQKKLVFEHDPDDDSDLDADDIEVIRTELLDTETELKIQDHVKTYKYVVQYKSYSN